MLLLGIDTATRRVGVVLASEHGLLARVELGGARRRDVRPRHAEVLAPTIDVRLPSRPASPSTICRRSRSASGPGMFTGLRVGVTTAKVLAQALRIPVIPIPSLDLLAYPLRHSRAVVVPAIDARRHEIYYALYRTGARRRATGVGVRDRHGRGRSASELDARGEEALLCGDGALRFAAVFADVERARARRHRPCGAEPRRRSPSWRSAGTSARSSRAAADVLPLYLRKSDAEISLGHGRARDGRAPRRRSSRSRSTSSPMRRRHLRVGAAHRGAGVPDAVDALAVRERARAAVDARVRRREGRSRRRRLRRA